MFLATSVVTHVRSIGTTSTSAGLLSRLLARQCSRQWRARVIWWKVCLRRKWIEMLVVAAQIQRRLRRKRWPIGRWKSLPPTAVCCASLSAAPPRQSKAVVIVRVDVAQTMVIFAANATGWIGHVVHRRTARTTRVCELCQCGTRVAISSLWQWSRTSLKVLRF